MAKAFVEPRQWVQFHPATHCYETGDGTRVAAELVDSAHCVADFLHIANIREGQRAHGIKQGGQHVS